MRRISLALAVLALAAAVPAVRADIFLLSNQGEVRGQLLNPDEAPRQRFVIRTAGGAEVTLLRAQVVKVVRENPAQTEYESIRASYPDTVEGQWELAEWCRENRLSAARQMHLERICELEPNHEEARAALGHSLVDGRWVSREQIMVERGYQRYKGKWMLPQEIELLERDRKVELAQKEWFQKLKRWRGWLDDPNHSQDGQESIAGIDDPFALKALGVLLEDEKNPRVRLLYLQALGGINTPNAWSLLVTSSLEDTETEVRLTALDQLALARHPDVTAQFVKALKDKDNAKVNRAALGLARMEDASAISPLIDALYTTHKYQIKSGSGGMSSSFTPGGGGGGFSFGQSTRVVKQQHFNELVRDALIQLSGVNFNDDLAAWQRWHAAQKKDQRVNGRRD